MNDSQTSETRRRARLRWVTLGEAVAIAALVISTLGLWHQWNKSDDKPTTVVEQKQPVPLKLRGTIDDDGRAVLITTIEAAHALESLTVTVRGARPIEVGSNGRLDADEVEDALGDNAAKGKGPHKLPVRIDTRYVEAGADGRSSGAYVITYRWEGGGLLGGRSLRIVSFSRG